MLRSLYDSLAYDMYEEAGEFLAGRLASGTGDCASGSSSIVVNYGPKQELQYNCSRLKANNWPCLYIASCKPIYAVL